MKWGLGFVSLLTASCADQPAVPDVNSTAHIGAMSVCELISHPKRYLGQEVTVVGIYGMSPHQRILFDTSCAGGELQVRIAKDRESIQKDEQLRKTLKEKDRNRTKVAYRGRFEMEPIIYGCAETACFRLAVSNARVLSVEPVSTP